MVVVGAGYGGIYISRGLEAAGIDAILVEKNSFFLRKIGGAKASIEAGYEDAALIPLNTLLRRPSSRLILNATLIEVNVRENSVKLRFASGETVSHPYDGLILAMGLHHGFGQLPNRILTQHDALRFLRSEQERVAAHDEIVIIGGGALGVETATQIRMTHPTKAVHIFHSRDTLMSSANPPLSALFRAELLRKVLEHGVKVHLGERRSVASIKEEFDHALVINATGCRITSELADLGLPERSFSVTTGEIIVDGGLRVVSCPGNVYAIGDLALTRDYKQARWAVMHGHAVIRNLQGERKIYSPLRHNPWYAWPLSFFIFWYVRARVPSTSVVALYLGRDGLVEFYGILFNDRFTRHFLPADKGASRMRALLMT